jgi:hypothetical protein
VYSSFSWSILCFCHAVVHVTRLLSQFSAANEREIIAQSHPTLFDLFGKRPPARPPVHLNLSFLLLSLDALLA